MILTGDELFWLLTIVGMAGMVLGAMLAMTAQTSRPRRRRPSVEEMADPAYNPDLDRTERVVRDALGAEADLLAGLWEKREGGR